MVWIGEGLCPFRRSDPRHVLVLGGPLSSLSRIHLDLLQIPGTRRREPLGAFLKGDWPLFRSKGSATMSDRSLVLCLAPPGASPPFVAPDPARIATSLELLEVTDSERLLHLARRRSPLAVLVLADSRESFSGSDSGGPSAAPWVNALARLPRPPRLLWQAHPTENWLEQQLELARIERNGRERLAQLLASRLEDQASGQLSEHLLSFSAADDAPRVVRGSTPQIRERAARALHDLSPRPEGGFLALHEARPGEASLLEEILQNRNLISKVSTLFVEGLEDASPERLEAWASGVRSGRTGELRLIFGRSEPSREFPAELESRCLGLDSPRVELRAQRRENAASSSLDQLERQHVLAVLDGCSGNKSRAAEQLGIHRSTLHAKLRTWGLPSRKV